MLAAIPIFLASAGAEAAEHVANAESLPVKFGLSLNYIAMQIVSFAILAFVLYRWGIKPVLATMDERQHKIESGLKYAEEMKAKLEQANQHSEEILRKAANEAQAIVNDARKTAKELADRQTQDTAAQTASMLAKAQQAIELEHGKMVAEVRGEIARLVTLTAGKVLTKELSPEEKARYTQTATRELTGV
jgi:F-type H+-transporting ATPase subunit b